MENFQLIFWQNTISPHQSSFLRTLATCRTVTLVVQNFALRERQEMGWIQPDLGNTILYVNPARDNIDKLIMVDKDAKIHIFSGIYSIDIVKYAYKKSILHKCHIGIMAEPFNWLGIKGYFRKLRERYNFFLYGKNVKFYLAIGSKAIELYKKIGYSQKVFDWAYYVENGTTNKIQNVTVNDLNYNIVYVGRLVDGKGIEHLINAVRSIKKEFSLRIIGDGPIFLRLVKLVRKLDLGNKITFLHSVPNSVVREILRNSDLLVLPSNSKDGWGAVINEALMEGCPVICSDNCGAIVLLNNTYRGSSFHAGNIRSLASLITTRIQIGKIDIYQRTEIKNWAMKSITGEVASDYFLNILDFVFNNCDTKPLPPWQNS
jgi:glycosyltransferase involved in cell wall biosynthesis